MRSLFFLSAFFVSCASLAGTTLQLTSCDSQEEYKIVATFTHNQEAPTTGTVQATTERNGECRGNFVLDLRAGSLKVILDGSGGPGTGGGCHNESMTVKISAETYQKLLGGMEVAVTFQSTMFYDQERAAMVKLIGR